MSKNVTEVRWELSVFYRKKYIHCFLAQDSTNFCFPKIPFLWLYQVISSMGLAVRHATENLTNKNRFQLSFWQFSIMPRKEREWVTPHAQTWVIKIRNQSLRLGLTLTYCFCTLTSFWMISDLFMLLSPLSKEILARSGLGDWAGVLVWKTFYSCSIQMGWDCQPLPVK